MHTRLSFRRDRSFGFLVAVLGAAVLAITSATGPALGADGKAIQDGADPITTPVPGGFGSWDELLAMQNRLNAAADLITSARDTGQDDGYGGLIADPSLRGIELYWRGPRPPRVDQAIEAARRDVPVVPASARYSEQELLDQGRQLTAERAVTGVAPKADGSGLTVSVSVSEQEARQLPAIRNAQVSLTIEPFSPTVPLFNRQNDIPPYWAGARYSTPAGSCSTGFAVRFGGPNPENATGVLSAGHCGSDLNIARDGGGEIMGPVTHKNAARDTLLIWTRSQGRVYTGGTGSATSLPVQGAQASWVGNWVCTSGAFTGQHCGIKVEAINVSAGPFFPMVKAIQTGGLPAAGHGDSGGPVISLGILPPTSWAKGTISAGQIPLGPCGLSPGCYQRVFYADITKTLAYYSATVIPTGLV